MWSFNPVLRWSEGGLSQERGSAPQAGGRWCPALTQPGPQALARSGSRPSTRPRAPETSACLGRQQQGTSPGWWLCSLSTFQCGVRRGQREHGKQGDSIRGLSPSLSSVPPTSVTLRKPQGSAFLSVKQGWWDLATYFSGLAQGFHSE